MAVVIVEFLEVPPEGGLRHKEVLVVVYFFQGVNEFIDRIIRDVADAKNARYRSY